MSNDPDYIVIRAAQSLSAVLPTQYDGMWFDRAHVPVARRDESGSSLTNEWVRMPTGRFEVRDDGAVAEVWEMRP